MRVTTEQRRTPRYEVSLTCDVRYAGRHLAATSRDLSRGGICLLTREPIPLSSVVELSVALVFDERATSEALVLPATVVWCTDLKTHYQIGAKFGPLPRQIDQYLEIFLRLLAGALDSPDDEPTKPGDVWAEPEG